MTHTMTYEMIGDFRRELRRQERTIRNRVTTVNGFLNYLGLSQWRYFRSAKRRTGR